MSKGMVKRLSKDSARQRKSSEDMAQEPPPEKKTRYNLRERKPIKDKTIWVDDDTLDDDKSSSEESQEENIQFVVISNELETDTDEETNAFLKLLTSKSTRNPKQTSKKNDTPPFKLTKNESKYYRSLEPAERQEMNNVMNRLSTMIIDDGTIPYKFRIMSLPVSDYTKTILIKKLSALEDLASDTGGAYKLRSWVDGFLRLPFGKKVPLPVSLEDGIEKCTDFMVKSRKLMDTHIFGMNSAKTQIMQMVSQWVVNSKSIGNVIALHGPPGIGKTSFARSAIASTLQRPFSFFTLGGSSDIANFVGHSYTYEGSTWGRIADSLMQCGTMNPVMYFDELDKISDTAHGQEIASMLIHLTDRSQNTEFHDRYFAGIDFDLSQCLVVFSFNDITKVHPILRDRMTIIECSGYTENDKISILKQHIWPQIIERLKFSESDIIFEKDAMRFLVSEHSDKEEGVRNLIRVSETIVTRLNMLRISKHESMKEYEFYMDVKFPLVITPLIIQKLLAEKTKNIEFESWRMMYV